MSSKQDFTHYIISEIKRRLQSELDVSSTVVSPNSENLKIKFAKHIFATFDCGSCGKTWASSKATC